jgi:arginyl-tRNA synthetase
VLPYNVMDMKTHLQTAVNDALTQLGAGGVDVAIQDVPEDKPGDYGTPVAFLLAKTLRKNPAQIAQDIVSQLKLPQGVAKAEAVGPYINFFVDAGAFVKSVIESDMTLPKQDKKVIVEHTSVNPNKEAHIGHLRNIVLGDSIARILKATGYTVEVQNYIDDTGRQAAESLYAIDYFKAVYDNAQKYDHWLGELYVKLQKAKETDGEKIEAGVREVMHRLERGELREEVAKIVRSQLQTYYSVGAEYDLLVWESDVVHCGFLQQGLAILQQSDYVSKPTEGKYEGATIIDVSEFIPGLEEPNVVLVRSDGNAMYVAKDIGYHYWKMGTFTGLMFKAFEKQPSGKMLYTSAPDGELHPDGLIFAEADVINVIDVRQEHEQQIVNAALKMSDYSRDHKHYHLAYQVVKLEGEDMSGRKGITVAIDDALAEAIKRVKAVMEEKNPDLAKVDHIAKQIAVGALRFGMVKSESRREIDFRWEQALSLQGDSAPYVQYAHARACSILRAAKAEGISSDKADFSKLGSLEVKLLQIVSKLPDVTQFAARDLAPHSIAQYCLDLANAWNSYYNHKGADGRPDTPVLKAETGLREARLAVVEKVKETLAASLLLLGIEAPEEM